MAPGERDQTAIEELRTLIRAQARRIEDLGSRQRVQRGARSFQAVVMASLALALVLALAPSCAWFAQAAAKAPWFTGGNQAASPSLNFLGTTNSQPLAFRTADAERMRIDSGSNVGIGSTAPAFALEVIDTISGRALAENGTTLSREYALLGGANATGTWPISITGTAAGTASAEGLQGTPVSSTPPLGGQVLRFDAGSGVWAPADGPLVAMVESGVAIDSPDVTSVTRVSTGIHLVELNRGVASCVRVASLGMPLTAHLNPASYTGQRSEVFTFNGILGGIGVATPDGEGDVADTPFHLVVLC